MYDPVSISTAIGIGLSAAGSAAASAGTAAIGALGLGGATAAAGTAAAGTAGLSASTLFASSLGISALGEGLNFVGQSQAHKAAQQSAQLEIQQSNLNTSQTEVSQALDLQQKAIAAANARATARTSAGEAGVTGNSVDALISDYNMQEGQYRSAVTMQQRYQRQQAAMRNTGYIDQAEARAPAPSPFASAIRVGGGALDAYNKFYGDPEKKQN